MITYRENIGSIIANRPGAVEVNKSDALATSFYGENVFNDEVMRDKLPKQAYKALKKTIDYGEYLSSQYADVIANAMRDWAVEKGATHFTHWFQPMTGTTAEKHDSFLNPQEDGTILLEFTGKELIKGEPDASSFPNGGIRCTFEARGYTAWDPTSPAFIRETPAGKTLCIPTAFASYTGVALDKKTPLLRSQEAISKSATKLLHVLGKTDVDKVSVTAGLEQEYFLIDKEYYHKRPDILLSGRSLFGSAPAKGQALDDHYFGSIKNRVLIFMQESEKELYKLGIPVKTRHNEVAPGQFEVAPVFENANLASDHNMLVMEVMDQVAARHNFKMLVHEKPFAGLNGSGKHCNWSMADNLGNNLLNPGDTPHENMEFIVVLTAIIRAIDKYAKLLRMSVASAGNDHRLGAQEAPPAIISAFLGDDLEEIVKAIVAGEEAGSIEKSRMNLGATSLPRLPMDNTDRNRTSPFAFTGNKFEFRALGSSQNVATPLFIVNTAVADSLDYMSTQITAKMSSGLDLNAAVNEVVKAVLTEHKRVIFNGDGYSQEWQEEAARRGLPNLMNSVDATKAYIEEEAIALFEKYSVLSRDEVEARYHIKMEKYVFTLDIEVKSTIDIASTIISPAALSYQSELARLVATTKELGCDVEEQLKLLRKVSDLNNTLIANTNKLKEAYEATPGDNLEADAEYYANTLIPAMNKVRAAADSLEDIVDNKVWPLPKYRELLFMI